jgi:hypothetical protein
MGLHRPPRTSSSSGYSSVSCCFIRYYICRTQPQIVDLKLQTLDSKLQDHVKMVGERVYRHVVGGGLGTTSKKTRRPGSSQACFSGVFSRSDDGPVGRARAAGRPSQRRRLGTTVRLIPSGVYWASLLHSRQSRIRQSRTSQSNSHTARWSGTSCTRPPNHPTILPNNFPLAISSPSITRYRERYERPLFHVLNQL